MGRIKKAAGPKHEATVSPAISEFVTKASTLPISHLPAHLKSFPRRWPFPKGDLYHWIPLFNRFDSILDQFSLQYGLRDGPQTSSFGRSLLAKGVAEESKAGTVISTTETELDGLGYNSDGDRQLIEVILDFSRRLLESCGNRSLYNSSERLGDLLNTTSLSLLTTTLQLAVRLAQRYHASRQRGANASQHMNSALLASHYSIDLEKVQKLANNFTKTPTITSTSVAGLANSPKGKEKAHSSRSKASPIVSSYDLLALSQSSNVTVNGSAKSLSKHERKDHHKPNWKDWGSVMLTYYQPPETKEDQKTPITPTPSRRPSGLSRPSRLSSSEGSPELTSAASNASNPKTDDQGTGGMRRVEIPYDKITSSGVEAILKEYSGDVPKESQYELLTKVRNAHAITTSVSTRQELIGIRLLAITNLAYIYPESTFQQKILQQDSEQPRRLQLVYQLADLVHPPGNGASGIPPRLQTLALGALEAFAKQKAKAADVCAALNVNVNHGVLFYILHKAVAEMATEDANDEDAESEIDEKQEALFSLLEALPASMPRTGETLVAAGLLDILIEVLNLRTRKAERAHPKVLTFLSTFLYTVRDAMQSLANSKGLDAISDLVNYEVQTSLERAAKGEGLPEGFRTRAIDYQIPYFQQQSLRVLFKVIAHMMTHGSGNLDRLLRNLIDSPRLLSGLRTVIVNGKIFGAAVWSGAINIMSTFIHNEPTSYAVISEAGLSKGLLEAITLRFESEDSLQKYLNYTGETDVSAADVANANANKIAEFMHDDKSSALRQTNSVTANGILPNSDAILGVPQAFGAICLNHSGMKLFLESGALDSFFKIFESDEHIKSMAPTTPEKEDLPRLLGSSFDELVRHHPNLKAPVMIAIMTMVQRVRQLCKSRAGREGCGAKLWLQGKHGEPIPAGEDDPLEPNFGQEGVENDVVMGEASPMTREGSFNAAEQSSSAHTSKVTAKGEEANHASTALRIEITMNFLAGFFENSALCSFFVEASGAETVLDLATLPSLQYDFNIQSASVQLAKVVHIMSEQKPHLVLPSLLRRTQSVADSLKPLYTYSGGRGFFAEFTSLESNPSDEVAVTSHASIGTSIVKSLVNIQTLCNILFEVFSTPIFNSRSSHTAFSQVNLADMYRDLIGSLGSLHRVCVWEEILLQKNLPISWKELTKMKGIGMGSDEADEVFGFVAGDSETIQEARSAAQNPSTRDDGGAIQDTAAPSSPQKPTAKEEQTAQFRNTKILRHLLSQVPSLVVLFYQNLGKSLVVKRRIESYARQNAYLVAEAMSNACLEQLSYEPPKETSCVKDRYAYWIVALTSISSLMIEGSHMDRSSSQVLTLLLQVFKNGGGLDAIKEILDVFFEEVKNGSKMETAENNDVMAREVSASGGLKIILGFYIQITQSKSITDSNQSAAIASNERDRGQPNCFFPPQFLVELRMAILPTIKAMWDSDFVDKAGSSLIKCLIDILRTILEGGEEQGAFKRGDEQPVARKASFKAYSVPTEKVTNLAAQGYETDLAREALYRCFNAPGAAVEYCQALKIFPGALRNPIPDYDVEKPRQSPSRTPRRSDSGNIIPEPESSAMPTESTTVSDQSGQNGGQVMDWSARPPPPDLIDTGALGAGLQDVAELGLEESGEDRNDLEQPPTAAPGVPPEFEAGLRDEMPMSIDSLQEIIRNIPQTDRSGTQEQSNGSQQVASGQDQIVNSPPQKPSVTIEDLDEERKAVAADLIDRALDVLNVHEDVTFELADLINAAASKAPDAKTRRKDIGETLVLSLISLQEDDIRPSGRKIASYANLLALVIQDRDFYEATLEQLKDNFAQFLSFIRVHPDQKPDEASPWIGQILLIIEKMLAEDVQPSQIQWDIPSDGQQPGPIAELGPSLVPLDEKIQLFEAISDILLKIGKDESLALSVVRTLVILTRNREIASRLAEKRNIQRLFVMIKQLAGMSSDRLPSTFMLLLRHIIEDEDTIRQIMRSEIMARFESRPGRQPTTDTTGYVKQMYDLVLRSPQIFIEITNEKLEIPRYDGSGGNPRPQILQLKPEPVQDKAEDSTIVQAGEEKASEEVEGQKSEAPVAEEAKPSATDDELAVAQKPKAAETKAPVVEHPSGVIHYLLTELLAYKDIEDPSPVAKEATTETSKETSAATDVAAGSPSSTLSMPVTTNPASPSEMKKPERPEFKPAEHPIHVYRNFILQCLTELLHSYNRTKIEFINFSRKADPKAMTPSKPRSGVLNYLLNDVIPVGTLARDESIVYRKKNTTSNWAMSAIVSLCLRTNENGYHKKQGSMEEDDETDILFVRKFVLEHALKAFKDANVSEEHLDIKYARLLDIADLFNRLLQGRILPFSTPPPPSLEGGFQKSIAKLMFEKNFIAALTGSIADIDLNFPESKRAIKYILRPLKSLTSTAIVLSQTSDISTTPGQTTDDDDISTATSVSGTGDEREETPDLFRNSTLGMFEPGREEESSSQSSDGDEEMYEDEYDERMDYEDGMERDDDEVISDEDEDLGEAGPMEGLPGDTGMDVEVVIDEEDGDSEEDDEDQDDSEDMDDDHEIEVIDEITGDSENASLAGGDEDGWQDEDGDDIERYNEEIEDNEYSQDQEAESAVRDIVREFGGAEAALQRLEGIDDGNMQDEGLDRLQMDIDTGRYMDDVVHRDEDDDEDDDDDGADEDVDDEDVIYQPDFDDEDAGMSEPPFGWDPDDDGISPRGHHHHHHHHPRRTQDPWSTAFSGGLLDRHVPLYRSHRPSGVPRATDDGVNPLLQRSDRANASQSSRGPRSDSSRLEDYWVHGMERRGLVPGESPLTFLNNLLSSVEGRNGLGFSAIGGPNGAVHLHIAGGPGGGGLPLPRELQMALSFPRHSHTNGPRIHREDHQQQAEKFQPGKTSQRWQEEARLLYGAVYLDKALRVVNSILRLLIPPALEKKKREEEEAKRLAEQAEKLRKEKQEAKEKAEKEEQEKREQEEREAKAAREEAEAAAREAAQEEARNAEGQEPENPEDEGAMEGVENTQNEESRQPDEAGEAPAPAATDPQAGSSSSNNATGPSEPAERVRTTIRGRELDITGLGIDLAYLDALPEDIREEVLMSQLAIQRSQAAASGEEPTDISREFLEALPADIREELLQQEAADRRRREREEARRQQQQAAGGQAGGRAPEDMDPASFLASLDPQLRQHVLMEQDEEMLANLPEEIAAEARALAGDRPMHRFQGIPRIGRGNATVRQLLDGSRPPPPATKKPPRRQIVQMLEKAGVATLLRLMFIPQQGSSRQSLNGILLDASQNRQNRAEIISLLLSILQDGSADVNAVERSFNHLYLRAKQPAVQKTPQPLKRTLTGPLASAAASTLEATPLMVIQQCLSALVSLTQYNPHVPSFFLTEHEMSKATRKGKGKEKETKASKFALNALLSLLDRKLIMESSDCMEQLASLLQSVTHPLTMLLRKDKASEESKAIEAPTQQPSTTEETTTEQPPQEPEQSIEAAAPAEGTSPMLDVQGEGDQSAERQEAPAVEAESKENEEKKPAEDEKKKARALTPPVVPEENLRLVVNILAARECSAKTFRDTLSTINNLSGIPGAKEVFGKGLIEQAQDLGKSILQDLDELVPQIKQAESGTEIQGVALAKFSPASSDQAKLLRVLTALDYLFDPKRNGGKTKTAAEAESQTEGSSMPKEVKEDILTTLYENATFGSLWTKLSECLSSIHQGEGMLNVATILLPLVEALMVVCKNTTLKDVPLSKAAKEFAITSPPPESYMENLFFKFTEDHRKILNDLVRHNPKLMSGTFSLLVKNPKVLEFDNKRNYFTRRLHSRGTEARHPQPPLQLSVRRDQVFLDSFKNLSYKSGDEIKYGKLSIRFHGEEGVDAGGVTREWFQVLSRQMFNPDYALFIPVASDRTTFHPNKLSKINDEHLMFFKFIGRIIGKALYEGRALDCHFSRAVYKRILGKTVSLKDMETLDLEYYKSLLWMLDNDISDIITETFSIETDDFGVSEIVDLCENGRNVPVTEENKQEYVQLMVEYRLTGSVQDQLEQFLKGFHDIVPPELIAIFNEQELELLISGLPDIDVDDWKNHTEYHNYQTSSAQIQWFWRAVRSFDKEERAKLLQFVTGTSKVPLNGFGQLEGMNGFSRFNIHRDYGNKDRLPSSHTCFNQLDLPEYESYETLRQQVYTAMTAGSEYFGFA